MRPDLEARLTLARNLPSPPGVALRLIALANDAEVGMAEAAEVIGMDAALTSRLLRIANSPLYARRRRVDNLSQALTLLGLNATLSLALGMSLVDNLRGEGEIARIRQRIWRRNVVCAVAARLLGQRMQQDKLEDLMLAGLLQDIGVMALMQMLPAEYPDLLARAGDNAQLLALEQATLGCTHAEIGYHLARHWRLSERLQQAIRHSESRGDASDVFDACTALSGGFADIWLGAEGVAAREQLIEHAREALRLDTLAIDALIGQLNVLMPDITPLFDVHIPEPDVVAGILEQARELALLRNLIQIQDAARARQDMLELSAQAHELADEARRDPLTGVFNRGQLNKVLAQEFEQALRQGTPLSVAFIDLDNFKHINDRHGHLVGDQVLQNFARLLQGNLRNHDIVARYGGEEFLIVLPGTDSEMASRVMQRILGDIARAPIAIVGNVPIQVTFSAGLATQGPLEQFAGVDELLKAADEALYGAKRDGRNRIVAGTMA